MTSQSLKNEIIMNILFSGTAKLNQTIDYQTFLILYSKYDYLPEVFFAEILGIATNLFSSFKRNLTKAVILKNFDFSSFELKEQIIQDLIQKGMIHYNMKINYQDFLTMLEYYPFLDENTFASILGINTWTLQRIRYENVQTYILRKKYVLTEEQEQKVQKLFDQKIIYPGMQINYEIFLSLKSYFGDIPDHKLAYILEISSNMLSNLKKGLEKPIILKSFKESFILRQKETIINELFNERNAYKGEKIDKKRFYELYRGFENISEAEFAFYILGIKYNNFRTLKSGKKNALIFKNMDSFTDMEKESICKEIFGKYNLQVGDPITYETFMAINQSYPNIDKNMLCSILGIAQFMYNNMKYQHKSALVCNGVIKEKIYFMKKHFIENRFYAKEELENIFKYYGVSLEDFICYYINAKRYFKPEDYIEAFENNQGLYVGKCKCSKEFIESNYEEIAGRMRPLLWKLQRRNSLLQREDLVQQAMLYLYEKCGDLEYNFSFNDKAIQKMIQRIGKMITGMVADFYHQNHFVYFSLDDEMISSLPKDKNKLFIDFKMNVEAEALEELELKSGLYDFAVKLFESGYSLKEILEIFMHIYPDMDEMSILENMKSEIVKSGVLNEKKYLKEK